MRHKALRWVVLTIVVSIVLALVMLTVRSCSQSLDGIRTGKYADFSWSPDAQQIAFTTDDFDGIYVMQSDGSQTRKIDSSSSTKIYTYKSLVWSPNGQEILFSASPEHTDPRGIAQIYSVKTDGSQSSRAIIRNGYNPQWSPDGKQIAFASNDESDSCSLQVTDSIGDQRIKLFKSNDCFYDIQWSPDSKRLIFSISRINQYDIYIANADGSAKPKHLIPGKSPMWSLDGKRIAFCIANEILVVDRDGKILSRPYNLSEANPYKYGLQWSSDNRSLFVWVITCHDSIKFSWDICDLRIQKIKANRSGKAQQILTFRAVGDAPSWSPDRKKIGFKSKGFLYVVNSDGSGLKKFK